MQVSQLITMKLMLCKRCMTKFFCVLSWLINHTYKLVMLCPVFLISSYIGKIYLLFKKFLMFCQKFQEQVPSRAFYFIFDRSIACILLQQCNSRLLEKCGGKGPIVTNGPVIVSPKIQRNKERNYDPRKASPTLKNLEGTPGEGQQLLVKFSRISSRLYLKLDKWLYGSKNKQIQLPHLS